MFGVGALFVARLWMPPHKAAAQSMPVKPAASDGAPMVVASMPIAHGAKLDARFLTVIKVPPASLPPGAFDSVGQVMGLPGGPPLALDDIAPQEPILPAKLTGPGERQTLAAVIGPNMRAYTIGVTEVSGGAGHVLPGDRVDVVMTRDVTPNGPNAPAGGRRFASEVILQDIRVLGMDQNANPTTSQPVVARTATLEVPAQDAIRLALAAQTGTLSLALRRTGEQDVATVRTLVGGDVISSSVPAPVLRGASDEQPHRRAKAPTAGEASVTVVQGEVATKQTVALDRAGAGF